MTDERTCANCTVEHIASECTPDRPCAWCSTKSINYHPPLEPQPTYKPPNLDYWNECRPRASAA